MLSARKDRCLSCIFGASLGGTVCWGSSLVRLSYLDALWKCGWRRRSSGHAMNFL